MKKRFIIVLGLAIWLAMSDQPADAAAAAEKTCLSCHSDLAKQRYVHGPVAAGECVRCHEPVDKENMYDARKHRFKLAREERELCYQCHVNDKTINKEVHGPVAVGDCVACHDPHSSPYQYRLIAQGQNLCFTCHTEKKEEFLSKRFGHPPAALNCSNCHDPHTSPNALRLNNSVPALCFGCHPEKRDHIANAKTQHDAYKIEKKCLNCHDPHYTNFPKQLRAAPADLCLSCHNKELETPTGKIMNMKKWLDGNNDWHGPIRQKDCPACHNPHGTDNFRLLKRPYPRDFYTPFDQEKYGLCFGCHERTLALDRFTTTLTNFRNGDESLHFRHVNQTVKGRTCRACHEVHASNNPKHIRDSVPYGGWNLPTNYVKYRNGGKCSPGCHVPRGYSRVRKVQNPIDYEKFNPDQP